MLEWLNGDPLNGIVITISFFVSLIIGRYIGIRRKRTQKKNIMEKKND